MKDPARKPLRDAHTDREAAKSTPDTPQTRAPAYHLAFTDDDFMCRDELRPVRLQLELLKPELLLDEATNLSLKVGLLDRYDSTPGIGLQENDVDYFITLLWKL